jgi:recombination protein RecA
MAPPFKQAEFDILYGIGISREGSLIDYGVEHEIVRKSGAWYTYDGDQLGQGKENARGFLLEHPEVADEIEKKILTKLGVGAPKLAAAPPIADAPVAATKTPRVAPVAAAPVEPPSAASSAVEDDIDEFPTPKASAADLPTLKASGE